MKKKTDVMPDKNSEEYKIRFGYPENEFVFCCNDDDTKIWVYHKSDSATFRQIDPGFSKANEKNFSRAVDYAMKTKKLAYFDANILKHPIFSNTKEQIKAKENTTTYLALKIYEAVEIQKAVDAGKDMNELQEDMLWKSDLLAHKMSPEKCETLCKTTFLEKAVRRDFDKMVKFLLEKTNADVNAKNNMGITGLFSCATSAKMARLLIKYGADVNVKDKDGMTPLLMCIKNENLGNAAYLMEHGADFSVLDSDGKTILDNAKEIFEKMKKSFIDKGIDYSKNRSYNYNLKALNKIQKIFGKGNP